MPSTPTYRTYVLLCPANAGKVKALTQWVIQWRELAELEKAYQLRRFRLTGGQLGLERAAKGGWSRPWVTDGRCSTTMAQQIMAQVTGQLTGHLGSLKNAVQALISEQAKAEDWDADTRHRLYSLNRRGLWWARGDVASPIAGETTLPATTLRKGRRLLLTALRQHRLPTFAHYHPQLDQRNCSIDLARNATSKFPLWARVSPAASGQCIELPLVGYADFLEKLAKTSAALAPGQAAHRSAKQARKAAKRQAEGKSPLKRPPRPGLAAQRAALPHTMRLILDGIPDASAGNTTKETAIKGSTPSTTPTLRVAVVLDHSAHDQCLRANYTPIRGKTVALDLGLSVLLATCEGDLLGRDWIAQIERYSRVIDAIAAHRQRLGLPVRSARYDRWVAKLDGFMKTEIYRLVAHWVARVKPERIIVSDDSWQTSPNMSKRMNRLASRFGKRHLHAALTKLESTHGIVVETRPGAYTSQECHACGYVDKRNRVSRDKFVCKCCKQLSHADVNAARTSKGGRSAPALDAAWPHARHTLPASVKRFVERNPRPEALEHRPSGRADDPRWSNPYFHAWQQQWTPRVEVAEASGRWRKPKTGASSGVSSTGQDARKEAFA